MAKRLIAALCAWLLLTLCASPAFAAPSNPSNLLGTPALPNGYENGAATTNIVSLTQDAAVNGLIVVPTAYSGTTTISSVKDSAGNCSSAYTATGPNAQQTAQRVGILYCNATANDVPPPCTVTATTTSTTFSTSAVVTCASNVTFTTGQVLSGGSFTGTFTAPCTLSGGIVSNCAISGGAATGPATATVSSTITTTFGLAAGKKAEMALLITGAATSSPVGTTGTGNVASGLTFSTSITPSTTGEMIVACVWLTSGSTSDAYAEDTGHGWAPASQTNWQAGSSTNLLLHCAYQLSPSTTAITWSPSWSTNNRAGSYAYISFKAAAGSTTSPRLLLLGVGR